MQIIFGEMQILKLLIIHSLSVLCYLILLRLKYLPELPVLRHPLPTFFSQQERPRFIPT
jgi:hypothetical protein